MKNSKGLPKILSRQVEYDLDLQLTIDLVCLQEQFKHRQEELDDIDHMMDDIDILRQ